MSINPSSDLVLDVIKAGDPTRAEAVNARLESLASTSSPDEAGFAQVLQASESTADAAAAGARTRLTSLKSPKALEEYKEKQARTSFEASILGNFMQELMPKDDSSIYGQGFAGGMWRSMLGDQIAHQIAQSGVFGISQKLFSTHGVLHDGHADSGHKPGSNLQAEGSIVSQNELSLPSNVSVTNDSYLFLPRKPT